MTMPVDPLLDKAHRSLLSAQRSIDAHDSETALNRIYYAAFYAATAALSQRGEVVKTHVGVQARFYALFVETGQVPAEPAQAFAKAFQPRQTSDYTVQPPAPVEKAAELLADVQRFVDCIGGLLVTE